MTRRPLRDYAPPDSGVGISLLAQFAGWISGCGFYLYMTRHTLGGAQDQGFILFYTGVFTFVGWLLFVLPLVLLVPARSRLFSVWLYPVFGALYGAVTFLILIGWMGLWQAPFYILYAGVVGASAGLTHAMLMMVVGCVQKRKMVGRAA